MAAEGPNFRTYEVQAVLFTSAVAYRGSRFLSHFLAKWGDVFSGEPVSLEPPEDFPPSVAGSFPRAILKSEDALTRLQVATERVDFHRTSAEESSVDAAAHFAQATDLFIDTWR